MKSVILAAMLSLALVSVVVLAGRDVPRVDPDATPLDEGSVWQLIVK